MTPEAASSSGSAFEAFFEANYETLLRAMYLITGDRHEAEEVSQDAFVKVFERWERVRRMENPPGYLYRTALNSHRSRRRRIATAARRIVSASQTDPISESDDRDALRRALAAVPAPQRDALVLVEWLGMTSEEAARVLGVSSGAVRIRVFRAKQTLRGSIERVAT